MITCTSTLLRLLECDLDLDLFLGLVDLDFRLFSVLAGGLSLFNLSFPTTITATPTSGSKLLVSRGGITSSRDGSSLSLCKDPCDFIGGRTVRGVLFWSDDWDRRRDDLGVTDRMGGSGGVEEIECLESVLDGFLLVFGVPSMSCCLDEDGETLVGGG